MDKEKIKEMLYLLYQRGFKPIDSHNEWLLSNFAEKLDIIKEQKPFITVEKLDNEKKFLNLWLSEPTINEEGYAKEENPDGSKNYKIGRVTASNEDAENFLKSRKYIKQSEKSSEKTTLYSIEYDW